MFHLILGYSDTFILKCRPSLNAARREMVDKKELIHKVNNEFFQVKNHDASAVYDIRIDQPSCTCHYKHLPCKHIFLLLETKTIKWEDFPLCFTNKSHTLIDIDVVRSVYAQCGKVVEDLSEAGNNNVDDTVMDVDENIDVCKKPSAGLVQKVGER